MTRLAMVSLALLTGCGVVQFKVEQALPEQTVDGSLLGGILPSLVTNPFTVTVDVKQETAKRNTGPASAVFLESLRFQATRSSGTFDFLDEVHLFIEGPGLTKREIATAKPIAKGLEVLVFTVADKENLLPYVNAGATLSVSATGRQPSKTFTFDGKLVLDIRV